MNSQPKNAILVTCKPRKIWKFLIILVGFIHLVVFSYFIIRFIVPLDSLMTTRCFTLFFVMVYGWIGLSFYFGYPPTLRIRQGGVSILHWNKVIHVSWNEIDFLWEKYFLVPKSLTLGSDKFPKIRRVAGLIQFFKWKSIYSITNITHTNYETADKILKSKLTEQYSRRYF